MKDIVEYIVKALCDYPDEVEIETESGATGNILVADSKWARFKEKGKDMGPVPSSMEQVLKKGDVIYAEKETDEKIFQRWCCGPQYEMSFEEFKNRLKPVPIMPDEMIIKDVFEIIKDISGGEPQNGNI